MMEYWNLNDPGYLISLMSSYIVITTKESY